MHEEIEVKIVRQKDRKYLLLKYVDPVTGKRKFRSAETANMRLAQRAAAEWEIELQQGKFKRPSKITWDEFRERYESEYVPSLAPRSSVRVSTVCNKFERMVGAKYLARITADEVAAFQTGMRNEGLSESTINADLQYLHAMLSWAKDHDLIREIPKFRFPKRAKSSSVMKGRPITQEEFDRMFELIPEVMGESVRESWEFLFKGLWWSGLRLNEALNLSWSDPKLPRIDWDKDVMIIQMPAAQEKGNRDRLLNIAPEFIELLKAIPVEEQYGYVFNPRSARYLNQKRMGLDRVSKLITKTGKKADVVVSEWERLGKSHTKYASAHDFRRAFGERWAQMLPPQILMQVMRHEKIETTMKYYVGHNVQTIARTMKNAQQSNRFSNSSPFPGFDENPSEPQPVEE